MRPDPADFRFRATGAADWRPVSCLASDAMWATLGRLPEAILFHPQLLPALEELASDTVVDGDLIDAIIDLVLNGAEV